MQETPDAYPGMPRWVKIGGIALLALVAVGIIVMLATGGQHGPWRHG